MPEFTIRLEDGDTDRAFITALNARLSGVIDAPTHSKEEVEAFQDQFTATAWEVEAAAGATFVAVGKDGQRLVTSMFEKAWMRSRTRSAATLRF